MRRIILILSNVTKDTHAEIEFKNIFLYIYEEHEMNSILDKQNTGTKLQGVLFHKPQETVETAGSLAGVFHSLFEVNSYDEFFTNNPFEIDYSLYSDCGEYVAFDSGFLGGFASAMATLGDCGSTSFSSGDCGGGFSCGSVGGFTSVC